MQIVDRPGALPGQCATCGSAERSKFVDTGLSFDFFGVVYICNVCIEAMAKKLVIEASPHDTDRIVAHFKQMESLGEGISDSLDRLGESLDRIRQHSSIVASVLGVDQTAAESVESDSAGLKDTFDLEPASAPKRSKSKADIEF